MYHLGPSTGTEWLATLRNDLAEETAQVVALHPILREASDGSPILLATLILRDSVKALPSAQRRKLLSRLENRLKSIILSSPYAGAGWPLVGFMTESDPGLATRRF